MKDDLAGRVAIVTGGSRGIGLAVATALLERGASVAVAGLDATRIEEAGKTLAAIAGGASTGPAGPSSAGKTDTRVLTIVADVRDHAQVDRMVERTVDHFGGLDILVNNAGVGMFVEVADMTPEAWSLTIGTNLTGVFHCCRAAIPHLKRRGGGWIVNISSLAGQNPFAGAAAYCASKAGLNAFTEALMQELRYSDIRVSCVCPGSVRTEFAGTHDGAGSEWKLAPEDVARVVMDLLTHDARSLPSRVEIRPSKPRKG